MPRKRINAFDLGFRQGRIAGFERGKQDGAQQGYEQAKEQLYPFYRKILVVTPSYDLPSLEIIINQPLAHLQNQGICTFDVVTEGELSQTLIEGYEMIVFLRSIEPEVLEYMRLANQLGKKTVYAVDDNFLEIPKWAAVYPYYNTLERREAFKHFLSEAQVVKTGAPYFADYIRQHYNAHVADIPDSFNHEWVEQAAKPSRNDGKIVIGYGGTMKDGDFAPVTSALIEILKKYKDKVEIHFHGYAPAPLLQFEQVKYVPQQFNYRDYIRVLHQSGWDIGMAPLADTNFNACKTNNKYREYSSCGIPGIYSRSPAYTPWIFHGENGYLTNHSHEGWLEGLTRLIEDAPLRNHIREKAALHAKEQFSVSLCSHRWKDLILKKGG